MTGRRDGGGGPDDRGPAAEAPRRGGRGRAFLGLRVRTGRAVAVVLEGTLRRPEVRLRRELALFDPARPASRQPFHAGLGLSPEEAEAAVAPACEAVRRVCADVLEALAAELALEGVRLAGAGLVVASLRDPARVGGAHLRAHAAEGRLFHDACRDAALAHGLAPHTFLESEVVGRLGGVLRRPEGELRAALARLGRGLGPPWRAHEKLACAAAWLRHAEETLPARTASAQPRPGPHA